MATYGVGVATYVSKTATPHHTQREEEEARRAAEREKKRKEKEAAKKLKKEQMGENYVSEDEEEEEEEGEGEGKQAEGGDKIAEEASKAEVSGPSSILAVIPELNSDHFWVSMVSSCMH